MTGVPTLSIHSRYFPAGLFEGSDLAPFVARDPEAARVWIENYLAKPLEDAERESRLIREAAIETFGIDTIAAQWGAYLGVPVRQAVAA